MASDCGPTFGKGPDLQVFKGTITKGTDSLPLNSIMVPGSYLWTQGTVTSLSGGKFEANDVHVYAVKDATNESTLERPFQDIDSQVWNAELLRKLKGEVENYWPLRDMGVAENKIPYINILLLGPVGAGKSSFYNTLNSIFRGRLSIVARTGSCDSSLTKSFNIYSIVGNGKKLKFRICDCRGLEDAQGVEINDIESVLDGHVKNTRRNPEMHDRIHCVAFVVDANNDPDYPMTERVHEQIKKLQDLMNNAGIPQLVLMNKIDGILDETGRELSSVFYSPEVKKRVDKLAKALRLPPNTVLPMKNIDSEQKPTTNIAILALYNLRQMLHAADDFLLNYLDDFLVLTEHVPPENNERNTEMVHERNAEKTGIINERKLKKTEMLHERKTEILSEETEIMTDPVTNKNSLLDGESNTDKESDID